jgi:hypothetical protein
VLLRPCEETQGRLAFMGIRKALFVAWCAWLGVLIVGWVVVLLLDEQEWRETVGVISLVVGFLAFIFARRMRG